ncbi:MAG: hypothetical protein ABSG89_11085 [Bacteroidales bacterium]|jgi:hypothetical protein
MRNKLIRFFLIIFVSLSFSAAAQVQVDSPVARFNLGLIDPAGSCKSQAMGGVSTAMRDNNTIYFTNPASYSSIDTNSFVFDFGMSYSFNIISDGSSNFATGDFNFNHLLLGFPVSKRIGVAMGVVPFSNSYYKVGETVEAGDPGYDAVTEGYTAYHYGTGNLSNVFLGTGVKLTKNFSAGINMSFLYGSIKRSNEFVFDDYYHEYHDDITETIGLNGIGLDYGLQYTGTIKTDYFINAGISYSSGKNCISKYNLLTAKFTASSTTDTLALITDDSTKAYIPGILRMGISFGKKNMLTVGIDYVITDWSKATFHGSTGTIADTRTLLFGIEYIPDKFSNYSFFKRVEYRIGGHVESNYVVLDGHQAQEWGASMGLGIPMGHNFSKTNIFIDYTRRSFPSSGFNYYENYFSIGASINLYDWWFLKRKYE